MTKFLILPFIMVGCTAPITDPPAHADLKQDYDVLVDFARKNIYYKRTRKRTQFIPSMLDEAIGDFNHGTYDTAKSEELLQLSRS